MPVIPRKRKHSELEEGELTDEPQIKRTKTKKCFGEYSLLGYKQDSCHSIYLEVPPQLEDVQDIVSKELVSLLNSTGGILCFGARATGHVYGVRITRQEEDVLKCTIDEVVKRIHPMVKPNMYRVSFTPVSIRKRDGKYFVLEIRVQRGDKFMLYETGGSDPKLGRKKESLAYLRDGCKIVGPLTPHQIKKHVTHLFLEKLKHEADLAQKLHTQTSKDSKKTPTLNTHSTVNKQTPASVEIVSVIPSKSTRCPLKVVNKNKLSEKNGSNKASSIVISSDESDECPLPGSDQTIAEEGINPKHRSQPPPPSAKVHKNKISSLVKSIKKTVKETFAPKSRSTQGAKKDANQNKPHSTLEAQHGHGQQLPTEVSRLTTKILAPSTGPTTAPSTNSTLTAPSTSKTASSALKTVSSTKTTTCKPTTAVHPLMSTARVCNTQPSSLTSSSQAVTGSTQSGPARPQNSTKSVTNQSKTHAKANPKISLRPPPAPPRSLPPVQTAHSSYPMPAQSSYSSHYPSSNGHMYSQYSQQQQYSGRYGEVVHGSQYSQQHYRGHYGDVQGQNDLGYHSNNYHGYQQGDHYRGYQQPDHYHQYSNANQHHQYNYPHQTSSHY